MTFLAPSAFLEGFGLGAGLIIAIGAQNAFVLRQGIRREHVFLVTTVCFLSDAALITAGALGVGSLIAATPWLTLVAGLGGSTFLFFYGARAFWNARRPGALKINETHAIASVSGIMATTLALTWLNPHVYLDTVVVLGSVAGRYPSLERLSFAIGAIIASMVWFYGLGYGAGKLAPLFARPRSWQILDVLIGVVMWAIGASLLFDLAQTL